MQTVNLEKHGPELESDQRFQFGKNWHGFLRRLSPERIRMAEFSLKQMLECDDLSGKTFLDVGSGSGLFSLAARRLGATILSFDYDPESVACTVELKGHFFSGDREWRIEQGSALDHEYLAGLGKFDVVYSWGVLHHTGDMWKALANMPDLVKPGGKLFIALYNDQGTLSTLWRFVKRAYNRTPAVLRFLLLCPWVSVVVAGMTIKDVFHLRPLRIFSSVSCPRGMSLWTDAADWLGGYPFEVASRDKIIGFYQERQFRLNRLVSCGRKPGCNEYVFIKSLTQE